MAKQHSHKPRGAAFIREGTSSAKKHSMAQKSGRVRCQTFRWDPSTWVVGLLSCMISEALAPCRCDQRQEYNHKVV